MFRLLLFCIVAAQALDFQRVINANQWTLKAAHHVVSKHVDVPWEDVQQIQDHYRAHRPMQIRNTDKQWSVDHAFKFLLKHGRQMKVASIKAQPKGFDFKGTLHGVHYKLKCTHRCRVHRTGHADFNQEFALRTPGDATQAAETLLKQENDKKLDLLAGESIRPGADSSLNCLRVIASQDCEYHDYDPLHNKQLCEEAMNDAVPEAAEEGIIIPVVSSASNLEGRTSPDCSTNGHVIIFNNRGENLYVVADGTVQTPLGLTTNWRTVPSHTAGAQEAPGDVGCSKHEPCICQYKKKHAKDGHTGERLLCDDVHDDYINRTALRHPHVNMLTTACTSDSDCDPGNVCQSGECNCHPADSIVRVQYPCDAGTCVSPRRMDELNIGDMAESDHGVFEPIIAFSHRDQDFSANYYEFVADNRTVLHISKGHYLYANKKLTLPKDVQLGDIVSTGETITDIRRSFKQGLFHPHTWSAKLVVDGVQTSCNTEFIEVSIQDYITTPFSYILYKLGVPIDMVPNSRFFKASSNAKLVSSWFDDMRPVWTPSIQIFFGALTVPMLLCWTFPEVLAVAAMGYYFSHKHTKIKIK